MINYTIYEDDKKLIVELNPPKDSSIDYQFLSENNFSKIEILYPEEKLIAEFDKNQELERVLIKGIVVNGKYEPLQKGQLFETQLIKPTREEKESLQAEKLVNEEIDFKKVWIDPETGEIVNKETGEVIGYQEDYQLSTSREWQAYDFEQLTKRARTGPPTTATVYDKYLTTMIDFHDKDAYGKSLSLAQKTQAYYLRKWQTRTRIINNVERSLAYGLLELKRISNLLKLPKHVLETASHIYRKAVKQRLTRGRERKSMIGSCIYYGCRICKYPLGLSMLCFSLGLDEKEVAKGYRYLRDRFKYNIDPLQPFPFISKLVNKLNLSSKTEEIALKIAKAAKEYKLNSWDPLTIAGASVYIASELTGKSITQREIANEIRKTDVTIRNRSHELWEKFLFKISL